MFLVPIPRIEEYNGPLRKHASRKMSREVNACDILGNVTIQKMVLPSRILTLWQGHTSSFIAKDVAITDNWLLI